MSIRQFRVIAVVLMLLVLLNSIYRVSAAPPEPAKGSSATPEPSPGRAVTIEGVSEKLLLLPLTNSQIGIAAVVTNEGFEGSWPASGWNLIDQSSTDGGTYRWGKRNCHPHTGGFAGWSVGGGTQGSALPCSANYPNNIDTWAVYGPFNLTNAGSANLTYHFWGQTEGGTNCPFDSLSVMSSIDGQNFSGQGHCGDATTGTAGNGYYQANLDLSNRLGQSQVWIAFRFVSDTSITFNGITVDDVTLDVTSGGIPNPPGNLTALGLSQIQVLLQWTDNSNNETGFKIEQSPTGIGGWTQIATTSANVTSHTPTGLTCATTYYYRVRAYNGLGNSTYSNIANVTTAPCTQSPVAPSNLTATSVSTTQINLVWQDNSNNELGFKIERSLDNTTWGQIASVGSNLTNYANTGLSCGLTHFYRVRAYNAGGNSNYSNINDATTSSCGNTGNTNIYLPIIFKSPPSLPPGSNHSPVFPNPFALQTFTQYQYSPSGQLIGAITTITIPAASDADGDPLTYTWTASNGNISSSGLSATWIRVIEFGRVKSGSVTVVVQDGRGGSQSKTINFQ